jgi:hypothetical protein
VLPTGMGTGANGFAARPGQAGYQGKSNVITSKYTLHSLTPSSLMPLHYRPIRRRISPTCPATGIRRSKHYDTTTAYGYARVPTTRRYTRWSVRRSSSASTSDDAGIRWNGSTATSTTTAAAADGILRCGGYGVPWCASVWYADGNADGDAADGYADGDDAAGDAWGTASTARVHDGCQCVADAAEMSIAVLAGLWNVAELLLRSKCIQSCIEGGRRTHCRKIIKGTYCMIMSDTI